MTSSYNNIHDVDGNILDLYDMKYDYDYVPVELDEGDLDEETPPHRHEALRQPASLGDILQQALLRSRLESRTFPIPVPSPCWQETQSDGTIHYYVVGGKKRWEAGDRGVVVDGYDNGNATYTISIEIV